MWGVEEAFREAAEKGRLASLRCPERELPHRQRETPLCGVLFASVRSYFSCNVPGVRQLHSNELAHTAFFHCHTVKNIGFRNGAFVVGDDNELALLYEAVEYADKTIDIAFVHCGIHLVENAEWARPYHVNRE